MKEGWERERERGGGREGWSIDGWSGTGRDGTDRIDGRDGVGQEMTGRGGRTGQNVKLNGIIDGTRRDGQMGRDGTSWMDGTRRDGTGKRDGTGRDERERDGLARNRAVWDETEQTGWMGQDEMAQTGRNGTGWTDGTGRKGRDWSGRDGTDRWDGMGRDGPSRPPRPRRTG